MDLLPAADLPAHQPAAIVQALAASDRGAVDAGTPRHAAAAANPPLAMGLAGINDWSTQHPFINLMKAARPWIGHRPGQWDAWTYRQLEEGRYLDAEGWPKALPEGSNGISTLILTGQPAAGSLAGRYRLTHSGEGTIEVGGLARNVRRHPGEIWFDYAPGEGLVIVTVTATDPRRNGNNIRDIAIVKAEEIELYEAGAIFNPRWIERIRDLRALRLMDWMVTNNSEVIHWSDRPLPSDFSYAPEGAPVETMVALANEIGADPWFTMPHAASDAYFQAFAEYVRDHLDRRLRAHVEYSNEVWNWQFGQARWADEQARTRWGADAPGDAWMQFAGMRAARMAQIWDQVFGAEAAARLVNVISTQTGWLGLEHGLLEAPLWTAEDRRNRPPVAYFDAYGVTGYFGGALGQDKAPAVRQWIADSRAAAEAAASDRRLAGSARAAFLQEHAFDTAATTAARELRDGSVTGNPDGSLNQLLGEFLPYQAGVAGAHGLDLVMYEGGTHVVGIGEAVDDPELTAFFTYLNYSPQMGELYYALLDGWRAAGGTLFNAFVDVYTPNKWGSWGALRHLDDTNPRWNALATFNRSEPAWWESRAPGTFDDGITLRGSDADDTLQGTPEEDTLIGGGGSDLLTGGGGADRLHGGEGHDTAILPGVRADYRFAVDDNALVASGPLGDTRLFAVESVRFAGDAQGPVAIADLLVGAAEAVR